MDIDLGPGGKWIGVTESGRDQSLLFGGKQILVPQECKFPKVAAIDEGTAIIVNSRAWTDKNAWIVNSSGDILAQFYAGDAIQDVLASTDFIAVDLF